MKIRTLSAVGAALAVPAVFTQAGQDEPTAATTLDPAALRCLGQGPQVIVSA